MTHYFLPSILQDRTFYLSGAGSKPPYQVPLPYRSWLLDPGSLTQRLIAESGGQFQVRLLRQGRHQATQQGRDSLGLSQREWPFLSEVILQCRGQPWVFARTLIPSQTLSGPARALTHLGTKPLGAVLFNHPGVRRGPISVCLIERGIWGRQSVFFLYNKPLLVSEYFLEDCPMYQLDTQLLDNHLRDGTKA